MFPPTPNRIVDIVPEHRHVTIFDASDDFMMMALLRRLAHLAKIRIDHLDRVIEPNGRIILAVTCAGRTDTIRLHPRDWLFPPSAMVAYLNTKLSGDERLVACRDEMGEVVALCNADQESELHACIFAVAEEMRWPTPPDDIERELIAAIRAAPDDNGPRHVYADWLTQQGDRRGELIMLQCHADAEVRDRAWSILAVHEPAWTAHLPIWASSPYFERGFVKGVYADRLDLRDHHAQLFAITPVPEVRLRDEGTVVQFRADGTLAW